MIITISDNGFLFVIDKEKGNIIKIKDIFKIYKDKNREKTKPIGFSISQDRIYLSNEDGKLLVLDLKTSNVLKVENTHYRSKVVWKSVFNRKEKW